MSEQLAQLRKANADNSSLNRIVIATNQNSQAARTFNISTILPDKYQELTLQNFAISNSTITYVHTKINSEYSRLPTSYDPSTGILRCGKALTHDDVEWSFYFIYDVVCFY